MMDWSHLRARRAAIRSIPPDAEVRAIKRLTEELRARRRRLLADVELRKQTLNEKQVCKP